MGSIFNIDSRFMQVLSKIVDLIILNILTLVCCIPIVTIGAAVTALYDATGRLIRDEGKLWSDYWKAFRSNFKQATVIWLLLLVTGLLIGFSIFFYSYVEMAGNSILRYVSVMLLAVWCIVVAWVFPLQAKFYNKVKETMRNALYCGIGYLPRTAMMVVMNMLPWVLLYYATSWFLQFGCVWIMIWFSLAAYVNCKLLEKPFERFTGEETVPAETKA